MKPTSSHPSPKNRIPEPFAKGAFILLFLGCATPWISAPIALVMGFLFTALVGQPFAKFTHQGTSWMLKIAVVGLGFGMNAQEALKVGREGFFLTITSISMVLLLGYLIGRLLKMPRKTSHLVASGTAICGGSAIAAVAPVVEASEEEVSVSLGVVFFLNAIALVLFPLLGHALNLSQHQFGLWSAIAIHDTSSVVGAASAYGEEALKVATTVKLARALWIIPVSFLSVLIFRSKGKKIAIPWFIALFIGAMILNSYCPAIQPLTPHIAHYAKSILVMTLFLIGSGLSIQRIRTVGFKPLILGILLWIAVATLSLLWIL